MDFTPLYTREPLTTHSYTKKHILKGRSLLYFFFFDQKKQKTKKKVLLTKILSKTFETTKNTKEDIANHRKSWASHQHREEERRRNQQRRICARLPTATKTTTRPRWSRSPSRRSGRRRSRNRETLKEGRPLKLCVCVFEQFIRFFFLSLSLNGSIDDASSLSCSFEARRFYGAFDEASSSSAFSIGFGTEGERERERKRARVRTTLVLLFGFEFCLSLKIPPTKKGERFLSSFEFKRIRIRMCMQK